MIFFFFRILKIILENIIQYYAKDRAKGQGWDVHF